MLVSVPNALKELISTIKFTSVSLILFLLVFPPKSTPNKQIHAFVPKMHPLWKMESVLVVPSPTFGRKIHPHAFAATMGTMMARAV